MKVLKCKLKTTKDICIPKHPIDRAISKCSLQLILLVLLLLLGALLWELVLGGGVLLDELGHALRAMQCEMRNEKQGSSTTSTKILRI